MNASLTAEALSNSTLNHFQLDAAVIERENVRYTPAGVPITACVLEHCSEVLEANIRRQVKMLVQALAAGACAGVLEQCKLGVYTRFSGFLAPRTPTARVLVFHITEILKY